MKFNFTSFLSIFFFINIIIITLVILLERKRPEKTIAWLLIITLLPPIGIFLYIFLGRNWKMHKLNTDFSPKVRELIYRSMDKIDDPDYFPLIHLIAENSESPLFLNNSIEIFKDGTEKFQALKKELLKAKHHIHLEYYIVKNDIIGNEIKDLLIKKSLEGIEVRFILDRVGSIKLGKEYIEDMIKAGIDVVEYSYFLAPLLKKINTQINYRNHRKIAIIDGKVGFVGGINIGDEYLGKGELGYWRDTHIMVKGDFVLGLQAVFIDDFWTIKKANNDSFLINKDFNSYFPKINQPEKKLMQLAKSGPNSPYSSIMQGILKMIYMATEHIYITTPYFVPSESIMEALKIASLSGVDVRILFPGQYDHFTVYYASKTYLAELLKSGAKVHFYDKNSFVHAKVITVDGKVSTIGTANMDIRSFDLNYEINAIIYDEETTIKLEEMFFEDLKHSKSVTEQDFNETSNFIKFIEAITRLFSALL
ncbi:cardiolipin synthase [Clostridium cochlearium]|uniref:Cardiolipin synthase n=1 Tax=Clostridium cochlearium TaxID=1494 RepID=A0A239YW50_CLOCO|nr:cardiolipin synthase [Clostridium cochlearium]MBU5270574.1 cardiolipin synthase [Clostridium cochlearium]MDU1444140.1 cardiolipin synthase [Clostridium cochlearium]SNV63319.1 cardiolipin synthetase 2 [Clostridium cochlearium]SQB34998.1 cardiolipin synthetase 2 [Clostridium cochlearium]STA91283.1 cardiolipin synthetase 2 [Clostridium cochlearium]